MTASRSLFGLMLALLLSACSSDATLGLGSSGLLTIGYKIKQLAFSWSAAPVADTYRLLENPDGVSGYSQIGSDFPSTTTAFDYDIAVHLQDWTNASYILESCVAGVCTRSGATMATDSTAAIGYFKASNSGVNDNFGQAVAVSDDGDTVAVGTPAEDGLSNNQANAGAVYVYSRVSGVWQGPDYLTASAADSGDEFGSSVALSSDGLTLAVGAWQEAGNGSSQTDNSAALAGAVYIFVRASVGGTWTQQAYLKASNVQAGDLFGQAVALSDDGNTLAVGAPGEDGSANGITDSGAVYTFTRSSGVWTQQAYLKASNVAPNDGFGNALSISANGNVLAVAAALEDNGINTDNGAAYIFTFVSAAWSEAALLRASNAGSNDRFGTSLALSSDGTTLAAGAPFEDSDGVGDNNNALDSGAVYVFLNSGAWSEQAMLKPAIVGAGDQFGLSVALGESSGNILAVGADQEDGSGTGVGGDPLNNTALGAGAGFAFTRASGLWSQHAYLKAPNTGAGDRFGAAMAMSGDGQTLGIGALNEDSNATGIGGVQSDNNLLNAGAVYLY
jgi:hypothetical protein